jgi:hypothetical protein
VESTETRAPAANGRQERQLIAGRYRLASFHRGDASTEVWRALDESTTQVVSLEFLRDSDPAHKEPFLAGARRLASVAQPSVMRVAAIHDDADGTFIVFEHLVHIPVPLEWLKPAVEAPVPPWTMAEPMTLATPAVEPETVEPAVASADATEIGHGDHGLSLLLFALRSRELSLIDQALLQESAFEFLEVVLADLKAVRLDPDLLPDARAFVVSLLMSGPRRAAAALGHVATMRPRLRVAAPRVSQPKQLKQPKQPKPPKQPKAPRLNDAPVAAAKPLKVPKLKAPRAPRAERAPGRGIRWAWVLTRGLSLGLLAAIIITLPAELVGNVGNMAAELTVAIRERVAAATSSTPALQRAGFEVPPLSAYGATFEAQAPYPTAHPNETVEWVVALRNTGSAGWYRGIDGAQASLILTDGATAGVQTTAYVGPGQVGWFVVHFTAPSTAGTSKVLLFPRIDGRGSLPDLGIYATVTVSPNP